MKLITWNVQWCRGIDGRVDPARIAAAAKALGDFDVLCLQEIAVNFPGLPGSRGENQLEALARHWPRHEAHYGAATDIADGSNGRSCFGNLILSRLPVVQVFRHLLPWPVDTARPSMQRIALEAVVLAKWGEMRVTTTHLEYYSIIQRNAQIEALRSLHAEACAHAFSPRTSGEGGGPFEAKPRPSSAIFTGDFNFPPEDSAYARMTALFDGGSPRLFDAWTVAHADQPHAPTVGLFENSFADHPQCFDYIFLTPDLADRVQDVRADGRTQASDHQPVLIELRD